MNDLKLGFIGCGLHAQTCLYPSLAALRIRLQSVCALHLEHAQEIAKKYGILHAYDNYKIMLQKEHLDAIFVAVSGEKQAQIVIDCLEAGVHVFVEKPLGLTVEEAQGVARTAKKMGKYVQVGFMKRFSPIYGKVRLFMEERKTFGFPLSFNATFPYGIFWICYNRQRFFLYAAIHNLDLLRYLVGEITEIHCVRKLSMDGISYRFNFKSDQGIIGSMSIVGLFPWAHNKEKITISGTKAVVALENNEVTLCPNSGAGKILRERLSLLESTVWGNLQQFYLAGYIGELEEFVKSVKNNKATINTAEENVKTMKLYKKIIESIQ